MNFFIRKREKAASPGHRFLQRAALLSWEKLRVQAETAPKTQRREGLWADYHQVVMRLDQCTWEGSWGGIEREAVADLWHVEGKVS